MTLERTIAVAENCNGPSAVGAREQRRLRPTRRTEVVALPRPEPTSKTEKLRLIDAPGEKIDFRNFRGTAVEKRTSGIVVAPGAIPVICNTA